LLLLFVVLFFSERDLFAVAEKSHDMNGCSNRK